MMGYKIDATKTGHVTLHQRSTRLSQAMDGNMMRWFGAFIFATQRCVSNTPTYQHEKKAFSVKRCRIADVSKSVTNETIDMDMMDDDHHQACAIVEKLLSLECTTHCDELRGGDTQNQKKRKSIDRVDGLTTEKKNPVVDEHHKEKPISKPKWKIGGGRKERDQLDVLKLLSDNNDRFAYNIKELERYTGPPMEIKLNSQKDLFRPPHK